MAELKGQIIEHICPSCNGIDKDKFIMMSIPSQPIVERIKQSSILLYYKNEKNELGNSYKDEFMPKCKDCNGNGVIKIKY